MTDERWQELVGRLKDEQKVESETTEDLEGRPGTVARLIVSTPIGRVRLSRTSAPRMTNQKTFYSKRSTSTASVQAEYDESDIVHSFIVEKDNGSGTWQELNIQDFSL